MSSSGSLCCVCFLLALHGANANAFLKANNDHMPDRVSEADVQMSLLSEIEGGLGTSAGSKVGELETLLQPIFHALPKNEHGRLSHTTVRYALHRAFVQRHGWFIQGLDRAGQSWNDSSPAGILTDQVPAYVQDLFEKRLAGKGFGLHELAALAATIEHLVHSETLSKLGASLSLHKRVATESFTVEAANEILETYMMMYILGEKVVAGVSASQVQQLKAKMPQIYLAWPETRVFIRAVRNNVTFASGAEMLDFAMLARVAERIGEQFGTFQDTECHTLKAALLKNEDRGTGRVQLADFYRPAHLGEDGSWQFTESVAYLRQLGALDESEAHGQRVIVSNYLQSQTNCIASSSFYSVCCMDECEGLLVHLEHDIKAPEATPTRILSLVQALGSSTVSAPRELSAKMISRLDDIAATHGGTVPLHGRLFLQWMHHAYPRECPFPHISGTTNPVDSDKFNEASGEGEQSQATTEEMQFHVEAEQSRNPTMASDVEETDLMPWSHEEELLVERIQPALPREQSSGCLASGMRGIVFLAALSALAVGAAKNGKTAVGFCLGGKASRFGDSEKFYV